MTEAEWRACDDPERMLRQLKCLSSRRKSILFSSACAHSIWDMIPDKRSREAILFTERCADDPYSATELARISNDVYDAYVDWRGDLSEQSWYYVGLGALGAAQIAVATITEPERIAEVIVCCEYASRLANGGSDSHGDVSAGQAQLLRDIVGNPFRPVAADPRWLTPTVTALAAGIYADRAFDRMPVLADALEDAGCDDVDVLGHCRGPGPHVRGCWVVDLLLGKT